MDADERNRFRSSILGHGFDNRYCHKGPIGCFWEVLYVPGRGFVRVPDYLTHFSGEFPLWTIDQGYVARVYASWYFWKFIRNAWFQGEGRDWCLCPDAPYALISLLFDSNKPFVHLANGYTESDLHAITIWISTKSLLRHFLGEWNLSLAYNQQHTQGQRQRLQSLLERAWHAIINSKEATPSDYVSCYWPQMNQDEKRWVVQSLTSDDRAWLKTIV